MLAPFQGEWEEQGTEIRGQKDSGWGGGVPLVPRAGASQRVLEEERAPSPRGRTGRGASEGSI